MFSTKPFVIIAERKIKIDFIIFETFGVRKGIMSTEAKEVNESRHHHHHHEDGADSSDDEADHKLPAGQSLHDRAFNFYDHLHLNFTPLHDILDSFKTLKTAYHQHKEESQGIDIKSRSHKHHHNNNNNSNNNTKTFDIRTYQRTLFDSSNPKKLNHTIAKFRLDEAKWDGTAVPSDELQKELYRTPVPDCSGTVIKSLARDLAKGKKWAPPEYDRDLPEPTFANCSASRQRIVLQHMDDVIAKVGVEYNKMKADTQDKSSLKARIGADLNDLKRKRERLLREIAEKEALMEAKAQAKRDKSPPRKKKEPSENATNQESIDQVNQDAVDAANSEDVNPADQRPEGGSDNSLQAQS